MSEAFSSAHWLAAIQTFLTHSPQSVNEHKVCSINKLVIQLLSQVFQTKYEYTSLYVELNMQLMHKSIKN